MEFNGPTFLAPNTVTEMQYPAGVVVENQLRVWAISRCRGSREFATRILTNCFRHLPRGSPVMFTIEEVRMGGSGLIARFTNPFDAYYLLG